MYKGGDQVIFCIPGSLENDDDRASTAAWLLACMTASKSYITKMECGRDRLYNHLTTMTHSHMGY